MRPKMPLDVSDFLPPLEFLIRPLLLTALAALALLSTGRALSAQDPAAIALATLPLPQELRAEATVVRLVGGRPDTLRAGHNAMVCLADDPADTLIDVRCYHARFVPLIYAARRLRTAGTPDSALDRLIRQEIAAGRLTLPSQPTAGYRVLGPLRAYHPGTNTMGPELDRWQSLHWPFATPATIGMVETESGAEPYLMAGGTWWAHVMIMQKPLRY